MLALHQRSGGKKLRAAPICFRVSPRATSRRRGSDSMRYRRRRAAAGAAARLSAIAPNVARVAPALAEPFHGRRSRSARLRPLLDSRLAKRRGLFQARDGRRHRRADARARSRALSRRRPRSRRARRLSARARSSREGRKTGHARHRADRRDVARHGRRRARCRSITGCSSPSPQPLPETLIARASREYIEHTLASWTARKSLDCFADGAGATIAPPSPIRSASTRCARIIAPARRSIARPTKRTRRAGRKIAAPLLALWGEHGIPAAGASPLDIWRAGRKTSRGTAHPRRPFPARGSARGDAARADGFLL